MDTKITAMSSEVSFEDGSITNFIVLRVPSGHFVRAMVSEESAKLLAENFASIHSGVPPEPPAPPVARVPQRRQQEPVEDQESGAVVFGGDMEEEESSPVMWAPPRQESDYTPPPAFSSENDPEEQAREYRRKKQKNPANPMGVSNARTIPKDSSGYPILNTGGVDPGELMGSVPGGDVDEDGIGSI